MEGRDGEGKEANTWCISELSKLNLARDLRDSVWNTSQRCPPGGQAGAFTHQPPRHW